MNPTASLRPWVQLPSRINGGFDTRLLAVTCALVSIGLVMVSSASISYAEHLYGDGFYFFKRHLIYLAMAAIAGAVVLQVPVRLWYRYSDLLMVMAVLLLVVVLIPGIGREVNGARRWIGLGIINLQIAEVAKLAMIVFLAAYLQRHQLEVRASWLGFLRPTGMLGIVALLLLLQPDFGSAVVICGTALGLLFLGGVQLWIFGALLGLGGTLLALLAITSPYRMQRLVTFLDPWADQFNTGYQLTQSLIAFGRGEWFGVGLGNSVQKLFYLPEAHTDFVFAIFAEEFGLVGVGLVIALFVALVLRILAIGRRAVRRQDWFSAYTAFGIGILLAGQAFINIGVTSGLLPTKGLTLPFVSYGGSSLLVSTMMVALVLRIGIDMDDSAWGQRQQVNRGSRG
ncbi:MAG: putative lipid II flippase FtsW [Porticoccaceae bacterium]|jgi:cell division protein FtsW|nr:putative lipid II flippase FtsW [Porticoccaceae bacterium]HLS99301.1 putative lipid II flippase FtsW [Porticoccaceae bacterium]